MIPKFRTTLMAAAIASLIGAPAWAAGDAGTPAAGIAPAASQRDAAPGTAETGPARASPSAAITDNPIYGRTPAEMEDTEVVGSAGETVGTVNKVVLSPQRDIALAVITYGGVLGVGSTEFVVPIEELELLEDGRIRVDDTKQELEPRDNYVPELYLEMVPNRPIREFSALDPAPYADERSVGDVAADVAVTARVNAAYAVDDVLSVWDIKVETLRGHVTLHGTVPNKDAIARAERIARDQEGVEDVTTYLQATAPR